MTPDPAMTYEYEITVTFLDDGQRMVQVQGVPYPLGLYNETGYDLDRLLGMAQGVIIDHRNRVLMPQHKGAAQ